MIKFLKNKSLISVERPANEVIEEIHDTFYTEVDRLLAEAKISRSLDTDKSELISKRDRLVALGFTNTKEVKEANAEIQRLELLKQENEKKKNLIEAINYFSMKYPNYKFITEQSVLKICEKYNLVYGAIDKYIGTVPDKNLKHIEDFKVLEEDECLMEGIRYFGGFIRDTSTIENIKYSSIIDRAKEKKAKELEDQKRKEKYGESYDLIIETLRVRRYLNYIDIDMKCPLEIAAPLKDFNMTNAEIKNFKISNIEIPDPVVLKPVVFNKEKYYLVVTAWGLEASDEIVVNQKFN